LTFSRPIPHPDRSYEKDYLRRVLAAAAAICSLAFAVDEKPAAKSEHVMFAAADLKWADGPPALPAGARIAVLSGDPGKPDRLPSA